MSTRVTFLVTATVAAAIVLFAAATLLFPLGDQIGGAGGLLFWVVMAVIASALPVRLPRGVVATVHVAPLLASIALGGPLAGAVVAAVGSTDARELRREVPWYGTLFNHASLVVAAVGSGMVLVWMTTILGSQNGLALGAAGFVSFLVASLVYFALNGALAVIAVSTRTGASLKTVWAQDVQGIALSLVGLAPLGYLMAQVFALPNGVGWWATPLFVVPLFTTRLAYHRYVETRELFEQTIGALAEAVDARDKYTRGHSQRVSHIGEAMCRVMRLPEQEIEKIKWAGLLHDIGKIGVRDNVLLKPGPLDKDERRLMNQHPTIGAEIVAPAHQLAPEAPLIRAHHEWWNGSGYPDGIEALDIPLGARILTIADAYEAMTSSRPYRLTPLSHEQAVAELEKFTGIQFDPEIVPVLVGLPQEVLDWRPDDANELPTMLHQEDPRDRPAPVAASGPAPASAPVAASGPAPASAPVAASGPAATSALTPNPAPAPAESHTEPDSGGPATRRALASDDVP